MCEPRVKIEETNLVGPGFVPCESLQSPKFRCLYRTGATRGHRNPETGVLSTLDDRSVPLPAVCHRFLRGRGHVGEYNLFAALHDVPGAITAGANAFVGELLYKPCHTDCWHGSSLPQAPSLVKRKRAIFEKVLVVG